MLVDHGSTSLKADVALVAHASAYGGVATHLNQFASVLSDLADVKSLFLFTNSEIELNRGSVLPAPTILPTLNYLWASKPVLQKFLVPLGFFRELWLAVIFRRALFSRNLVITSHDPNAFWGLVLFAGQVDYFLFVLPDSVDEKTSCDSSKFKGAAIRLWRFLVHRLVKYRLDRKKIRLIAPTNYAADVWALLLGIDVTAIRVIPNPPFLSRLCNGIIRDTQPNAPIVNTIVQLAQEGLKLVLSVGHLEDYKNPHKWLEIAKYAHERDSTLLFVWAGDGPLFEEVFQSASGFARIFLTGRLNQSDLKRLYKASWVFFHPAIKESQGIVVMDALTFGMPVILNESEALPGLIGDSGAGFVLDCSGSHAASEFMDILEQLRHDACYQGVSLQAKSLASSRYSHEKWLAELYSLFFREHSSCRSSYGNDG